MGRAYCALTRAVLSRGLELPWTVASTGVLEPVPGDTKGQLKFLGIQKLHMDF